MDFPKCQCDCHYHPGIMHCFPCCDRCYEQYIDNELSTDGLKNGVLRAIQSMHYEIQHPRKWSEDIIDLDTKNIERYVLILERRGITLKLPWQQFMKEAVHVHPDSHE